VRQILYPLDMMFRQPVALRQIDEWKPLPLGDARSLVLLSILGAVVLLCVLRKSELQWQERMLVLLAAWLAISHRRMLFPCGILIAPILSRTLSGAWQGDRAQQDRPALNAVLLVVSLLTVCWALPDQQTLALQVEQKSPTKAVQFIKTHHLSGKMLNEFSYGGYLIWELPENPVFVDGRSDIFEETGVLSEFGRWATRQSDPQILLDQYGIDFCVLSRGAPMVRVLPLLRSWSAVYIDENSVIFERAVLRKAP